MPQIFYSSEFIRWIKKLDKSIRTQIMKKLAQLSKEPLLGKPLGNVFKNKRSLRIGKYRILYSIKKEDIIVTKGNHRKHAYEP